MRTEIPNTRNMMVNDNSFPVCKGIRWFRAVFLLILFAAGNLHALSVAEFGAVGDGKTDDAPAFQKAIDRAAARNEPLEIGEGTFYLGSDLVIEQPLKLLGEGHTRSVFTANGGNARIFVRAKIGRASCRERVESYVVVAGEKKNTVGNTAR